MIWPIVFAIVGLFAFALVQLSMWLELRTLRADARLLGAVDETAREFLLAYNCGKLEGYARPDLSADLGAALAVSPGWRYAPYDPNRARAFNDTEGAE